MSARHRSKRFNTNRLTEKLVPLLLLLLILILAAVFVIIVLSLMGIIPTG